MPTTKPLRHHHGRERWAVVVATAIAPRASATKGQGPVAGTGWSDATTSPSVKGSSSHNSGARRRRAGEDMVGDWRLRPQKTAGCSEPENRAAFKLVSPDLRPTL